MGAIPAFKNTNLIFTEPFVIFKGIICKIDFLTYLKLLYVDKKEINFQGFQSYSFHKNLFLQTMEKYYNDFKSKGVD
jgi:hypothetical protein